ncbi:hypothetical protein [Cytobacillus citreus]|nr:hypothetical protein [Cytobacillus citreus]
MKTYSVTADDLKLIEEAAKKRLRQSLKSVRGAYRAFKSVYR